MSSGLLTIHMINSKHGSMHRVFVDSHDRPVRQYLVGRRGGKFGRFVLSSHLKKESLGDDSLERPGAKAPHSYKLILRWIKTRNTSEREIHLTFAPASQDKLLFEGRGGGRRGLSKATLLEVRGWQSSFAKDPMRSPSRIPCFGFVGWWTQSVTVNRDPTMSAGVVADAIFAAENPQGANIST